MRDLQVARGRALVFGLRMVTVQDTDRFAPLGALATYVLHGVDQYLANVAGFVEYAERALEEGDLSEVRRRLDGATLAGRDGVAALNRFLGRPQLAAAGPRQAVDLSQLLHEVAQSTAPRWRYRPQAEERLIQLEVAARRSIQVTGWRECLRTVFTNLILNAIDALPEGGEIRVTALPAGDRVIVEVTDNGVGMSSAVREHCFDPFYTTKPAPATGLGLAVVRWAIERHGGTVDVESHPGRGSIFRLLLPAAQS